MNILVCIKQIPDPEVPARHFRLTDIGAMNLVPDVFSENALETALQFGGKITALSFGAPSAEETLRKALAMKADAAVLVVNDGGNERPDPLVVAQVLAAAARKLGPFDLILTGRESGDWGTGQTGALLAEELGLPCLSFVDRIEARDGGVRLRRQTEWGTEVVDAATPVMLTITNDEHNVPRIPKVRDVMAAHRQPLTTWSASELGVDLTNRYYDVVELSVPTKETACELLTVDELAQRLVEVTAGA
jgi:electron transfer flavoprotein beta subunit